MNQFLNFISDMISDFFGKVIDMEAIWQWFFNLLPRFGKALLLFVAGWWLSGIIAKIIRKAMERGKVDEGIRTFFYSCIKAVLKVVAVVTALATLGMNVPTLVAALGTAGVTLGLALKDSLSNVASGVLILFNDTFKVGDYIEIDGQSGTVKRIELMFTTLATPDNKRIVIPNSIMTGDMIINYTAKSTRRLELTVGVAYKSDMATVKNAIFTALKASEYIHWENQPIVGIKSFDDSAITFDILVWVDSRTYAVSRYEINEHIFNELNKAGVEIPFNQLDVHMIQD